MSSSRYALGCVTLLALASGALATRAPEAAQPGVAAPPADSTLACPKTISVTEAVAPLEGWSSRSEPVEHRFERISVFNKDSAGEYDLAPDDEKTNGGKVTQTWQLQGYRTLPLFLTCRYHGTSATLSREIPKPLSACTLTFTMGKGGNITGESSMGCH